MKKSKLLLPGLLALALVATHGASKAGAAITSQNHDETRAYAGLQWITGETSMTKPNLVLGLRQTRTNSSDKVTGADLTFTYSLEKNQIDALRLGYLDGKCDVLATAGLGYSFKKNTVLGFAGAVGPYSKLFGEIDGNLTSGLGIELNTRDCAGSPYYIPG